MYRKILLWILALIFSVSWGIAQQVRTGSKQNATDGKQSQILTLVTSFGDENLPSEYLLAYPLSMQVNTAGNIYVFDEQKIKVYNPNGKPKCIIGGPGEGPGEFGKYPNVLRIAPNDFLTTNIDYIYNIFKPDNTLVKKSNIKFNTIFNDFINNNNFELFDIDRILALNENTLVVECTLGNSSVVKSGMRIEGLVYLTDKDAHFITKSEVLWGREGGWVWVHWSLINESTIVYSSSNFILDKNIQNTNQPEYILTLSDIARAKKREIRQKYQPVALPDSIKEKIEQIIDLDKKMMSNQMFVLGAGGIESLTGMMQTYEKIKNFGQFAPVQKIRTDGTYIFVFTYKTNKNGEIFTDVFDAQVDKYITSVYFPFIPLVIKNGYAYSFNDFETNKSLYPKVEKYTIDHSVYGK